MDLYRVGRREALRRYGANEKTAILGSMLLGGGLHLGANAAFKTFKNTAAGQNFMSGQMATGARHALAGQKINPIARNVATYGVGPESMVNYDLGQQMGGQLAQMGKGDRYRALKKTRKAMAMTTHLRHAPGTGEVIPAINQLLSGEKGKMDKLPTVPLGAKPTLGQKAVSLGLGGLAIAAEPHSAIHMGINAARNAIGHSAPGQRFMRNQAQAGFERGMPPKGMTAATDLAVSPAALDTRRVGSALAQEAKENPQALKRLGGSLFGSALGIPNARTAISQGLKDPRLAGALERFKTL